MICRDVGGEATPSVGIKLANRVRDSGYDSASILYQETILVAGERLSDR
jgi:hypothetical protein